MKINGIATRSEQVIVEVDNQELYSAVKRLVHNKVPTLRGDNYVSRTLKLMEYEYTHPHNNDEVYKESRDATQEEIKWDNFLKDLHTLLRA